MNRTFYSILILLILVTFAFSQTAKKSKTKLTEIQKLELKRVKFDPKRDPNLDLQNAVAQAQKENKRIILDVGGEWCGWCKKMEYYLMKNSKLEKLRDKNYVWVRINMSEENENKEFLSKYPEIPGYPHLYVLEKDGTLLHSQNTADLEEPDIPIIIPSNVKNKEAFLKAAYEKKKARSYDMQKFTEFLNNWKPAQN